MLCFYGCGQEAKFPPGKGRKKWCCSKSPNSCPEMKRKNAEGKIPWNKGRTGVYSEKTLKEMSKVKRKSWENPDSGLNSDSRNKKLSDKMKEQWEDLNSVFNSDLRRKKIRIAAIKRIEDRYGQAVPNYNPDACKLIDEYGKENGYNFQHAENGGEHHIKKLGYWVDGYDKEKNVVIEVDESFHFDYNGDLKEKDIIRQKEIEKYLNCEFIRLRI